MIVINLKNLIKSDRGNRPNEVQQPIKLGAKSYGLPKNKEFFTLKNS